MQPVVEMERRIAFLDVTVMSSGNGFVVGVLLDSGGATIFRRLYDSTRILQV